MGQNQCQHRGCILRPYHHLGFPPGERAREFVIDNRLVRIHLRAMGVLNSLFDVISSHRVCQSNARGQALRLGFVEIGWRLLDIPQTLRNIQTQSMCFKYSAGLDPTVLGLLTKPGKPHKALRGVISAAFLEQLVRFCQLLAEKCPVSLKYV